MIFFLAVARCTCNVPIQVSDDRATLLNRVLVLSFFDLNAPELTEAIKATCTQTGRSPAHRVSTEVAITFMECTGTKEKELDHTRFSKARSSTHHAGTSRIRESRLTSLF